MRYYKETNLSGEMTGLIESNAEQMNVDEYTYTEITADEYRALRDAMTSTHNTLTPSQLREAAYNTERVILWDGDFITVTEAAQQWQYYAAEGNIKADELQTLIAQAKAEIRAKYPDGEVSV